MRTALQVFLLDVLTIERARLSEAVIETSAFKALSQPLVGLGTSGPRSLPMSKNRAPIWGL